MSEKRTVLVAGGTGYIGSHAAVELLTSGYKVVIVDNLGNSKACVLGRIERIAGWKPRFTQVDTRDRPALSQLFSDCRFDAVVHFREAVLRREQLRDAAPTSCERLRERLRTARSAGAQM